MSDKVIVVLPGDEARGLSWIPRVRASLDRDPDELVEQVARAIESNERMSRSRYRDMAEAAVAALTGKGKD